MESRVVRPGEENPPVGQQLTVCRACDTCRKKKKRCEPNAQGCIRCTKYGMECHFSLIKMKKKSRRPAGYKYISKLEERLKEIEYLLTSGISKLPSGHHSSSSEHTAMPLGMREPDAITLWPSSGAGEYDSTTSDATSATKAPPKPSRHAAPDLGPFSMSALQELPAKPLALELVKETFQSFNRFLPLFDEVDFLDEFQIKYSSSMPRDPTWWACLNVVLSMAHRFCGMRAIDPSYDNGRACGYIHNALTVVSELTICHDSLPAVQALVGMATIIQGTANYGPSSALIAAAMRLAQAMNLHQESSFGIPSLTTSQVEQRRRVFWIAYIVDKDISLRMGHPFSQDDDDMDVHLPTKMRDEIPRNEDPLCSLELLNHRISLAVIQGQVYKKLYSVQARRQSESQNARAAQELHTLLSYWKSNVEVDIPDELSMSSVYHISSELMHKLGLRLTYVHCLTMIDRHMPRTMKSSWSPELVSDEAFVRFDSTCVLESRKAICLLKVLPQGHFACVWLFMHAFFAATATILSYSACGTTSTQAKLDIHLVQPFLQLLEILAKDQRTCSNSEESKRLRRICDHLREETEEAIRLLDATETEGFMI